MSDALRRQQQLIDKLEEQRRLEEGEWVELIGGRTPESAACIRERARAVRDEHYGRKVYTRGLIELSSYCKNNCYYCGIRRSNNNAVRYRLSDEQVMACCREGYKLGFRTFVLQGGEDLFFSDERLVPLVARIHGAFPDCAITLSMGERSRESYQALFDAGAGRYLLRHETADHLHYKSLHPQEMSPFRRHKCLFTLREIGYQVGSGFMVGSPGQTAEQLARDMDFLHYLQPHMIGIGPFIPHRHTMYAGEQAGSLELTLFMLACLRLAHPKALIPATTALGTIDPKGREQGILSGANVVMPNLSPVEHRKDYDLYDNKLSTGEEAAECRFCLQARMARIGYELVVGRGDTLVG